MVVEFALSFANIGHLSAAKNTCVSLKKLYKCKRFIDTA